MRDDSKTFNKKIKTDQETWSNIYVVVVEHARCHDNKENSTSSDKEALDEDFNPPTRGYIGLLSN